MKKQVWLSTKIGIVGMLGGMIGTLAIGCGDDVASNDTDTDTEGTSSSGDPTTMTPESTSSSTGPDPDTTDTESTSSSSGDPTDAESSSSSGEVDPGEPVDFIITIENISDQGPLPTPFSPGVWIEQDSTVAPVFSLNAPASAALVSLAEDGDPSALDADIQALVGDGVIQAGVFDTPVGGAEADVIMPGDSYQVEFTAQPGSRLGLASMMGATNDVFWATGPAGISLYTGGGAPIDREITVDLNLFDAGSEANQPPGGGAYQPPGGLGANVGPSEEGVISERNESTRAIVGARRLLDVDVEYVLSDDMMMIEGLEFTFTNISNDTGGFVTPLSPITWALHDDTVSFITPGGSAADLPGLEALAEDGDGTTLAATLAGIEAVDQAGVAGADDFGPGESITFTLVPAPGSEILSFGTMVVMSNDAIIALEPQGVPLLGEDEDGNIVYRNPNSIANDLLALMEVWDVGTEANQTPGAGADIGAVQADPNTGDADPDATIRYYNDPTNDLASIADDLAIGVDILGDNVSIRFLNGSDGTEFQFTMAAGVGAMAPEGVALFDLDTAASAGLESLAEDGVPTAFIAELGAATAGDVVATPVVASGDLGDFFDLTSVASTEPVFHFAAMIAESNDTFLSTGPDGVNIFNDAGELLSEEEIETAILAALRVYDAGTEQNQAAARGADMAPLQGKVTNVGANEGNGNVRIVTPGANGALSNEPVWEYPSLEQMIRVTVSPAR